MPPAMKASNPSEPTEPPDSEGGVGDVPPQSASLATVDHGTSSAVPHYLLDRVNAMDVDDARKYPDNRGWFPWFDEFGVSQPAPEHAALFRRLRRLPAPRWCGVSVRDDEPPLKQLRALYNILPPPPPDVPATSQRLTSPQRAQRDALIHFSDRLILELKMVQDPEEEYCGFGYGISHPNAATSSSNLAAAVAIE